MLASNYITVQRRTGRHIKLVISLLISVKTIYVRISSSNISPPDSRCVIFFLAEHLMHLTGGRANVTLMWQQRGRVQKCTVAAINIITAS